MAYSVAAAVHQFDAPLGQQRAEGFGRRPVGRAHAGARAPDPRPVVERAPRGELAPTPHGRERRESVERVTGVLFGGEAVASLNDADLDALATEITTVPRGNSVIDTLTTSGVTASNGEAKRLIAGNAVSVNGQKITDDITITETSLVKKGKNSFVLVR